MTEGATPPMTPRDTSGRFLPRDPELRAVTLIVRAMRELPAATQQRIMRWALDRWSVR